MPELTPEANTMAELRKFFSRIHLIRQRGRKLTVIVLVVAIVLSMGALTALHLSKAVLQKRTEELRDKAAQLEADNAELLEDMAQVDSIRGIVEIAEEELGLVQPDAVFYGTEPEK